jgi:hypothetical protein
MSADNGKELFRIGFLTAIEVPERGFVGGLLVTNQFGRPLEFQCTAPLKPNRTQEILYGPTLVPYVLGDLIGRTLLEKVAVKPHLVLTERHDLLSLRDVISIPVACIEDATKPTSTTPTDDPAGSPAPPDGESATSTAMLEPPTPEPIERLRLGRQLLRFHSAHAEDHLVATRGAEVVPTDADLSEPFDRVREALNETAGSGGSR